VKLRSEDGRYLEYAAVDGAPTELVKGKRIEIAQSPINRRALEGEALVIGNLREQDTFQLRDQLLQAGINSVMLAPLMAEERPIGVLSAYRKRSEQFQEDDLAFFRLAAELLAIAIDNARQNEAVERLMEERTQLMLHVAHNLRAPISASATMLDTLTAGYLGPISEKQKEYTSRIGRRLHAMQGTIGQVLSVGNIGRIDARKARTPVELTSIVEDVATRFADMARTRGLSLDHVVLTESDPQHALTVSGHGDLLVELLENLVSNAVKYTPRGGNVEIRLNRASSELELDVEGRPGDAWALIEIVDTGIGIPEDEQGRLGTEFFRASNAQRLEEVGTGLGLAVARRIVELHGGTMKITSQLDEGTTVRLLLPLSQPSTADESAHSAASAS